MSQKQSHREEDERAKSDQQQKKIQKLPSTPSTDMGQSISNMKSKPDIRQRQNVETEAEPPPVSELLSEGIIKTGTQWDGQAVSLEDLVEKVDASNVQPEQEVQVEYYGQQLQFERELRGWTQEQLAEMIDASILEVQNWEANKSIPDLTWQRKLSQVLEKDIHSTSQSAKENTSRTSQANGTLQIRITQKQLTAQNFTSIISALTELHTHCWLIQQDRFVDVIEYAQTRNNRFVEEANLVISELVYNSPLAITFAPLDPKNIAEALVTGIDGVSQAKLRYKQVELDNQAREQQIQIAAQQAIQGNEMALLELERKKLEIASQRVELFNKYLETAHKMITILGSDADQVTKDMLAQTLLPSLHQLGSGKGLT